MSESRSNVDCLLTGIHLDEGQPISHVCWIIKGHSASERTNGDVFLNTLPGSYMNQTLTIKS
jgi:hypothetical protein